MDNINGRVAFEAALDINDFNVLAQAMERSIKTGFIHSRIRIAW